MLDALGQVYAWASPEWVLAADWRLVMLYADYAMEEVGARWAEREARCGLERRNRHMPDSPDPEAIKRLRLGKVVRK